MSKTKTQCTVFPVECWSYPGVSAGVAFIVLLVAGSLVQLVPQWLGLPRGDRTL